MKKFLGHFCMCVVSGFASQIGYMLAYELINKYYDSKYKKPIGFNVR